MNALASRLARKRYADLCEDRSQFYLEELCDWYVGPSLKHTITTLENRRLPLVLFPGVCTRKDFVRVFIQENALVAVFLVVMLLMQDAPPSFASARGFRTRGRRG